MMIELLLIAALAAAVVMAVMCVRSREQAARNAEQLRMLQEQTQQREQERQRLAADSQNAFSQVASQLLQEQTARLRAANDERMADLLSPLGKNIETLSRSIEHYKTQQATYAATVAQQIDDLRKMNTSIGDEARQLSRALRGDSKVQGDWGELMLKQILDTAGLKEGVNYDIQVATDDTGATLRNDDGKALRPDAVLRLPDGKNIVVDSKVSITAYAQAVAANEGPERDEAVKRHVASVRAHVAELGNKAYQRYVDNAADFVLMFVPNEPAYIMAMAHCPQLWDEAYKRQVVIVSPTHLLSVVRLLAQLWARDSQDKNAAMIATEAGRLYDKVAGLVDEMGKVRGAIGKAADAYDRAYAKIDGRGGIISKAEKLRELGAKTSKRLPQADD